MDKIKKLILPSSNYKSRISLNDSPLLLHSTARRKNFHFLYPTHAFPQFLISLVSIQRISTIWFHFPDFQTFDFVFQFRKNFRTSPISPSINFFFPEIAWIIRSNFYRCHAIATISRDPRRSFEERFERIPEDGPGCSSAEKNCPWTGWKIAYHLASFSSRIYTSRIKHYLPLYLISFVPWIPLSYVFVWIEWSWWSYFEVLKWMASWTEVKIHEKLFKLAQVFWNFFSFNWSIVGKSMQ